MSKWVTNLCDGRAAERARTLFNPAAPLCPDIYVCRRLFRCHKASLIFLSWVRAGWGSGAAPPIQMIEWGKFKGSPLVSALRTAASTHFRSRTNGGRPGDEEMKPRGGAWGVEGVEEDVHAARTRCQPERPAAPRSHPSLQLRSFDSPDCLQY